MAPSPTGEYHIGSMRTMLYNYAWAKKNGGQFILRIEDTDRQRFVPGALERTLKVIRDYGLSWDEGPEVGGPFEPYIQSQRLHIYSEYAKKLVEKGLAYCCFCSEEALQKARQDQKVNGSPVTKYNRHCLMLSGNEVSEAIKRGEKHVIRFKMPENEEVFFEDLFLGKISFNSSDLDDYVLLKSDGYPTYHLAVVVDDRLMRISHVLRGVEWLPSTPKHILLYKALGWDMPIHGHLSNLKEVGANKKLSKRSGSVDAVFFLKDGYLPEALLNFLMFLGWNPGTEKEIYSLSDFIKDFSLERVHKSDLVAFDRDKLLWLNGYYLRSLGAMEVYERIVVWAEKFEIPTVLNTMHKEKGVKLVSLILDRLKKLSDFEGLTSFIDCFETPPSALVSKFAGNLETAQVIIRSFLESFVSDKLVWDEKNLELAGHEVLSKLQMKPKDAFMTLRVAISGKEVTPPLFATLELLGREVVLERLRLYI